MNHTSFISEIIILNVIQQLQHISMLDNQRKKIQIPYLLQSSSIYGFSPFHNPYLTKLTIKMEPQLSQRWRQNQIKWYNPLHNTGNISIRQSLPLYKSQSFLLSLNWREDIRHNNNFTHLGLSSTWNLNNNYQVKWKSMMGVSWLNQVIIKKKLGENTSLFANYSGFFQHLDMRYHMVGLGGTYKGLTVGLNQKIDSDLILKANYEKLMANGLYLRLNLDSQINRISEPIIEAGIGYYWSKNISAWLKTVVQPNNLSEQVTNLSVSVEANLKSDCFIASLEYREDKSILYLGYKCPSFNFIFPVLGIENPIPALVGLGLYIYGYLHRKKEKRKKAIKEQAEKISELKLISDKANENYKKEELQNGLLIEEVYIGQMELLKRFLDEPNRVLAFRDNQQYKTSIFDATISFRFYVQKGTLNIPVGNKQSMLGCYYNSANASEIGIYLRYQKEGAIHETIVNEYDSIIL